MNRLAITGAAGVALLAVSGLLPRALAAPASAPPASAFSGRPASSLAPVAPVQSVELASPRLAAPRVMLSFTSTNLTAGHRPVAHVSTTRRPAGATVFIQRLVRGRWVRVARVAVGRSGRGQWIGTALALGAYRYRAVVSGRHTLAVSAPQTLHVYGRVTLAALLHGREHSASVNGTLFTYAWSASGWDRVTVVNIRSSSCSSVHVVAVYALTSADQAPLATLAFLQLNKLLQSNVAAGGSGTLASRIGPGTWEIAVMNSPGAVYLNGDATCFTVDGRA